VYGKLDPKRLRRILTSTSKPLAWHDGKLAHTPAELSIESIMLNDTDHFVGNHTFSVQNTGSVDLVFELGHRKAVTMYTLQPGRDVLITGSFPNTIVEDWASVEFSSRYVVLPPHQTPH
jgi:hypothetical protein